MSGHVLCFMLLHPELVKASDHSCKQLVMQARVCRASQLCWTWSTSLTG